MAAAIPNVFTGNTAIKAADVNTNFSYLTTYINSNLELATDHASDIALLPKGKVGFAQVTAAQGTITTVVDLTSLTVTFTALASRYYRITGFVNNFTSSVTTDRADLIIADGSSVQIAAATTSVSTPTALICFAVLQPGAGSKTYKLRAQRGAGTGNVSMNASATTPAFILIEDIGL